jgi:tryptophan synthase beta chain
MNDALRDWVTNVRDTFYCIGTVAGPHPYPAMVRDFQSIIGKEVRWQMAAQEGEGRLPDTVVAASAAGPTPWACSSLPRRSFGAHHRRRGRRQGRRRPHAALRQPDRRAPRRAARQPHLSAAGPDGQILEGHSISAGLDYPGIGPEHSWLHDRAGPNMSASPMPRRWRPSSAAAPSPSWKASSRRWSPAMRWPM